MLMIHMSGAIKCHAYFEIISMDTTRGRVTCISPLIQSVMAPKYHSKDGGEILSQSCSFSSKSCNQLKIRHVLYPAAKKWLCRLRESSSSDDEYRSSRNIAISLFRRYKNFVDRGGGDNLKDFITAGVNAYALGCTDEGLRMELTDMRLSGLELEAMQANRGKTGLMSKIFSPEIDECILWLSIIFITILCTPQPTIVRWSSTSPVSDEISTQWKGFCSVIANAYYVRGMAWLPVKTLQLEQMATMGHAEETSVVASRMRLVFSTLEVVSPQWPVV